MGKIPVRFGRTRKNLQISGKEYGENLQNVIFILTNMYHS